MTTPTPARTGLHLAAHTAAELMTPNPVSIRAEATVPEAVALLTDKGLSAAPVIDAAGQPVGVVSRADIVVHDRERGEQRGAAKAGAGGDPASVREIMTPVVFSVRPDTPAAQVVADMLALRVHQLFVVDQAGTLVGVITALDVLDHLQE